MPDPQAGTQFIVCDGGGSTADISAYQVNANISNEMSLAEIGLPSCMSDPIYPLLCLRLNKRMQVLMVEASVWMETSQPTSGGN